MMLMITEKEFRNVWGVQTAPSGDFFWFVEASNYPLNRVWTVVETSDDSDGTWYALPGYHAVNKIGYVVTEKPWDDETPDAIYFLDDMVTDDEARFLDEEVETPEAGQTA